MHRYKHLIFSLLCTVAFLLTPLLHAELKIPEKPEGFVSDYAQVLSFKEKKTFEELLRRFAQQSGSQILIALFPSLEEEELEDFSIRLTETWKVGRKGKDNAAILFVFMQEKKIRIEVGYGLEGTLTDAQSRVIIENSLKPAFKSGHYAAGFFSAVIEMAKVVAPQLPENWYGRRIVEQEPPLFLKSFLKLMIIIITVLLILDTFRYFSYRKRHRHIKNAYSLGAWFFRFALTLIVLGLLFRMLFYATLLSRGGYYGSRSGFGSSPGGGGSFGGGGASGSW
jgi:uncharacterized protein